MLAPNDTQNISVEAKDEKRLDRGAERHARGNLLAFMTKLISNLRAIPLSGC
jgi:hypothetical protein